MSQDKRRSTRSGLTLEDQRRFFYLRVQDQDYEIHKVRDVSISGVGLEMQRALEPGERVSLTYDSDDFQLSINGKVIWCRAEQHTGNNALGIEFSPENGQNNSLFFLALRKYLDDFDATHIEI